MPHTPHTYTKILMDTHMPAARSRALPLRAAETLTSPAQPVPAHAPINTHTPGPSFSLVIPSPPLPRGSLEPKSPLPHLAHPLRDVPGGPPSGGGGSLQCAPAALHRDLARGEEVIPEVEPPGAPRSGHGVHPVVPTLGERARLVGGLLLPPTSRRGRRRGSTGWTGR